MTIPQSRNKFVETEFEAYPPAYPLERARFGKHLHQFRQRVLRLDLLRDVGDVRGAVGFARRKKRQQTEKERERRAPVGGHGARWKV